MSAALWCVLIAIFLPYVCTGFAKFSSGTFRLRDNHDPRGYLDTVEGVARRAHSAQLNSFEIFPAFAAGVIIAELVGNAEPVTIDVLAVLFVTSRLLYIICYLADWAMARTLVWLVGVGLIVGLFVASA